MSRYDLNPHTPDPRLRVTIGWDRPLHTYFAQVFREPPPGDTESDDEQILWRGFGGADELSLVDAINLLAPYAGVPDALRKQLVLDRSQR